VYFIHHQDAVEDFRLRPRVVGIGPGKACKIGENRNFSSVFRPAWQRYTSIVVKLFGNVQ